MPEETRQRQSARVFVARETARDAAQLARQMARGEVKAASVAWATVDELKPELRERERHTAERREGCRSAVARSPQAPRDSLNAKVRAVLEARQQRAAEPAQRDETPRRAHWRELEALDRNALREAARADRVGSAWNDRPMTVQDAARLVDPVYAAAADRTADLRNEATEVEKSIQHYEGVLRRDQVQGDRRWREIGFLRQVMHKTGMRRDHNLGLNEGAERMAVAALDKLEPRRPRRPGNSRKPRKKRPSPSSARSRQRRPSWRSARNGRASPARSWPNGGRSRTRPASGSGNGTAIATRGWSGRSRGSGACCSSAKGWPPTP